MRPFLQFLFQFIMKERTMNKHVSVVTHCLPSSPSFKKSRQERECLMTKNRPGSATTIRNFTGFLKTE